MHAHLHPVPYYLFIAPYPRFLPAPDCFYFCFYYLLPWLTYCNYYLLLLLLVIVIAVSKMGSSGVAWASLEMGMGRERLRGCGGENSATASLPV